MHRIALSQLFSLASLFLVTIVTSLAAFIGRPVSLGATCLLLAVPAAFVFILRAWQMLINHSNVVRGGCFVSMLFWIFIPAVVCLPGFSHGHHLGLDLNWLVVGMYVFLIIRFLGWSILPHLVAAGILHAVVYHYVLIERTDSYPLIVSFVGVCAAVALGLVAWALQSGVHRPRPQ